MSEIPHEPLHLDYTSSGFLPDAGIYRRGDVFYQGTARTHYWLFFVMFVAAVVVAMLPWHTRAVVGELKYWIAAMCLLGGFFDIAGCYIGSAVTHKVTIDPGGKTLTIIGSDLNARISWEQIIELQVCWQKVPGHSGLNGYQLNLAWRDSEGVVRRYCLLKHSVRPFVTRLGRRYEALFGFTLRDYIEANRTRLDHKAALGPEKPENN